MSPKNKQACNHKYESNNSIAQTQISFDCGFDYLSADMDSDINSVLSDGSISDVFAGELDVCLEKDQNYSRQNDSCISSQSKSGDDLFVLEPRQPGLSRLKEFDPSTEDLKPAPAATSIVGQNSIARE